MSRTEPRMRNRSRHDYYAYGRTKRNAAGTRQDPIRLGELLTRLETEDQEYLDDDLEEA